MYIKLFQTSWFFALENRKKLHEEIPAEATNSASNAESDEHENEIVVYANQGQKQRMLISDLPGISVSKSLANLGGFKEEYKVCTCSCIMSNRITSELKNITFLFLL